MPKYDAVVVGSGPNGLSAAIELAKAGLSVILFEAKKEIGGGLRSYELTLPGFIHDMCSAIHPLAFSSPFFSKLPLKDFGLQWIKSPLALVHPFDDEEAVTIEDETFTQVFANQWDKLQEEILAPLHVPHHPLLLARFSYYGLKSAERFCRKYKTQNQKALFAALAAHSFLPLNKPLSAAFGIVLATLAHVNGWPFVKGGSQKLAQALASYFESLGGKIVTGTEICELPEAKAVFFDTGPRELLKMAKFPLPYQKKLLNFRYGPGVFKIDWALKEAIPWKDKKCLLAATVHLGGKMEEISLSERQVWQGIPPQKPFIILAQQSLFDSSRAPEKKHTAWAYCHIPPYSDFDMTERIENQIERFAPGFKEIILAKSKMTAKQMQDYNPNYVGGDINGGLQNLGQLFSRPKLLNPYATPLKGVYLCSSSTPPGGGVHGMCGYLAAKSYLYRS